MPVTFQPLRNGVLLDLEPDPEPSKVIAIAGGTEKLVKFATVVAVGPEVRDAKVGQRVLCSITASQEILGHHLIQEPAIIGLGTE